MEVMYKTTGTATGGREGQASIKDGGLDVQLTPPKELGGPGGDGTNPEQLFACGYSACFLEAMQFVGGQEGIKVPAETTVTATVALGKRDDGEGFTIAVDLVVDIPGVDKAQAEELIGKAHVVCPYSYATKGNISVSTALA